MLHFWTQVLVIWEHIICEHLWFVQFSLWLLHFSDELKNRTLTRRAADNGRGQWVATSFAGIIINQHKLLEGKLKKYLNNRHTVYPVISFLEKSLEPDKLAKVCSQGCHHTKLCAQGCHCHYYYNVKKLWQHLNVLRHAEYNAAIKNPITVERLWTSEDVRGILRHENIIWLLLLLQWPSICLRCDLRFLMPPPSTHGSLDRLYFFFKHFRFAETLQRYYRVPIYSSPGFPCYQHRH